MSEYKPSKHAYDMLQEREIKESWLKLVMEHPERKEFKNDGTIHYIGPIEEYGGRYLRVVVNPDVEPQKIVTLFFDRGLGRKL